MKDVNNTDRLFIGTLNRLSSQRLKMIMQKLGEESPAHVLNLMIAGLATSYGLKDEEGK